MAATDQAAVDGTFLKVALSQPFEAAPARIADKGDTDIIFNDGRVVTSSMSFLQASSGYFGSTYHFERNKDNGANQRFQVHVSYITPRDDVFAKLLLFMRTRRQQDLAIDDTNIIHYITAAFFLEMPQELRCILHAVAQILQRSAGGHVPLLFAGMRECPLSEEQMVSVFEILVTSITRAPRWVDSITPILTFPTVWLLVARYHNLIFDFAKLRARLQEMLRARFVDVESFESALRQRVQIPFSNYCLFPERKSGSDVYLLCLVVSLFRPDAGSLFHVAHMSEELSESTVESRSQYISASEAENIEPFALTLADPTALLGLMGRTTRQRSKTPTGWFFAKQAGDNQVRPANTQSVFLTESNLCCARHSAFELGDSRRRRGPGWSFDSGEKVPQQARTKRPFDLAWLADADDTDVVFNNGKVVPAKMSVLRAASGYLRGNHSFHRASQSRPPDQRFKVAVSNITTHDDIFAKILLFMYTKRSEDLAIDISTVVYYIAASFFLDMQEEPCSLLDAAMDTFQHTTGDDAEIILNSGKDCVHQDERPFLHIRIERTQDEDQISVPQSPFSTIHERFANGS
ncbi:hypothetical protein HKX48_006981 [Thoreauomyces humboldtii]|nr:hypothetical protein HKX48_006981 [Thoreauomyces humboldtii]